MASNLNQVCIEGNLTKDPEMRYTAKGMHVLHLSIASNRYRKNGDEFEKETSYFDVQCWDKLAENVYNECRKGTPVIVTGRLKQDRWMGRDGKNASKIIIVADNVNRQERQPREHQEDYPQIQEHQEGCPF